MTSSQRKRVSEGNAVIAKAGLSSQKQIEAMNLWKAVVYLSDQLAKRSMHIDNVCPEDLVSWLQ